MRLINTQKRNRILSRLANLTPVALCGTAPSPDQEGVGGEGYPQPGRKLRRLALVCASLGLLVAGPLAAQEGDLPPCGQRAGYLERPWVDALRFCLELVVQDDAAGELAFTALAAAEDGTLYAARPWAGAVLAIEDTDGDRLPDTARVAVDGLARPAGLAYHAGALYIVDEHRVYRRRGAALDVIVDNLPAGGGFWNGGIAVGPDGRLYVATGAPCDHCAPDDPARGAILSFDLNGGDRQIAARGLRHPAALAFAAGALWTVDTARDGLFDVPDLDELNRVTPGAHFGWPFCVGAANAPDWPPGAFNCASATPPALTFPTHSSPLALAAYRGSALPSLAGALLVALGGSHNQVDLRGNAVAAVYFDDDGAPSGYHIILPEEPQTTQAQGFALKELNYRLSGLYPSRPYGLAVSPEGWVYISSGRRIVVIRPQVFG